MFITTIMKNNHFTTAANILKKLKLYKLSFDCDLNVSIYVIYFFITLVRLYGSICSYANTFCTHRYSNPRLLG